MAAVIHLLNPVGIVVRSVAGLRGARCQRLHWCVTSLDCTTETFQSQSDRSGPQHVHCEMGCLQLSCLFLVCIYVPLFCVVSELCVTQRGSVIPRVLFPVSARWCRRAGTGLSSALCPEQLLLLNMLSWSVGLVRISTRGPALAAASCGLKHLLKVVEVNLQRQLRLLCFHFSEYGPGKLGD